MRRHGRAGAFSACVAAVAAAIVVLPMVASCKERAAAEPEAIVEAAVALVEDGQVEEGRALLESIVEESPDVGNAWYLIGYAEYQAERYGEAAAAFERSAALGYRTPASRYALACMLSLDGQVEPALDAFAAALAAGFDDDYLIAEDPDLDAIREHPRFAELFTPPPPFEPHPDAEQVEMQAASGHRVFGEMYPARDAEGGRLDRTAPIILLLHQAGSNSAEYVPVAPRLAAVGFHALALDSRGGGRKYGRDNLTVEALAERGSYDDAMEDFQTAVSHLRADGYSGPLTVWGSSYSASRMFRLVVEGEGEFAAGLAFSPGPPTDSEGKPLAGRVEIPVFVTWPESEFSDEQRQLFESIGSETKRLFVQQAGRHGSSTLHTERNPQAEEVWTAVLEFLDANSR